MLSFLHDSQNSNFRIPAGAVTQGTSVDIFVDAYDDSLEYPASFEHAGFLLERNIIENGEQKYIAEELPLIRCSSEEISTGYGRRIKHVFKASVSTKHSGIYFYRFVFKIKYNEACAQTVYYGNNEQCLGGIGQMYGQERCNAFQITVYRSDLTVPDWFLNGIIYQIFPDRFCRANDAMAHFKSNSFVYGSWYDTPMYIKSCDTGDIIRWDFFGGNLMGVAQKLPYIESLGASVIYLNPIFDAVSNHRYDTSDYMHVDSVLGGDSAFDLLIAAGHMSGIRFILDGVFSHTGRDSIYFDAAGKYGNGAYGNPASPFRKWYRFGETDDDYECWWGVKAMPNVEELEPTYLDYTVQNENSVIRHWIGKGASGWRLDVADELPDEFIRKLRIAADEAASSRGDEAVIIGEVWEDASNKVSYGILRSYFTDKELHSVTNYPFRNSILAYFEGSESAELTIRRFKSLMENYPVHNFYALINMTGTHDVERLMTVMLRISDGDISAAKRLVKAYAAVMFTFPGVPLVYYGDETCVEGGTDPDNRRTYPWAREDGDMINHFSELARLRRGSDVLTGGFIEFINARNTESDCSAVAYMRYNRDGLNVFGGKAEKNKTNYIKVICAVNRYGRSGESIELSGLTPEECFTVISSDGKPQRGALCGVNSDGRLFLEAVGTYVLLGVPGAAYR